MKLLIIFDWNISFGCDILFDWHFWLFLITFGCDINIDTYRGTSIENVYFSKEIDGFDPDSPCRFHVASSDAVTVRHAQFIKNMWRKSWPVDDNSVSRSLITSDSGTQITCILGFSFEKTPMRHFGSPGKPATVQIVWTSVRFAQTRSGSNAVLFFIDITLFFRIKLSYILLKIASFHRFWDVFLLISTKNRGVPDSASWNPSAIANTVGTNDFTDTIRFASK